MLVVQLKTVPLKFVIDLKLSNTLGCILFGIGQKVVLHLVWYELSPNWVYNLWLILIRMKEKKSNFELRILDLLDSRNVIFSYLFQIHQFSISVIGQSTFDCSPWIKRIDAKDMNVIQLMWLSGCPKKNLFSGKNSFLA